MLFTSKKYFYGSRNVSGCRKSNLFVQKYKNFLVYIRPYFVFFSLKKRKKLSKKADKKSYL